MAFYNQATGTRRGEGCLFHMGKMDRIGPESTRVIYRGTDHFYDSSSDLFIYRRVTLPDPDLGIQMLKGIDPVLSLFSPAF